jgi:hypothetical protein
MKASQISLAKRLTSTLTGAIVVAALSVPNVANASSNFAQPQAPTTPSMSSVTGPGEANRPRRAVAPKRVSALR